MTEHTLFCVMPYLKSSGPVRVRGILFWPTERLDENEKISSDCRRHFQRLFPMFQLRHGVPIERMLCTHLHLGSGSEDRDALRRLREARTLICYLYSFPHFPGGDPFLLYEHADLYLFEPAMVSKSLVGLGESDGTQEDPDSPPGLRQFTIEGYEGSLNHHSWVWVAQGSRLYPALPNFWLNESQDLSVDLDMLRLRDYTRPFSRFISVGEPMRQESENRIFTALEWYNRSSSGHATEDVALVFLATAFESLLSLEQGENLTRRFKETILGLMGKSSPLESWVEQFYRARSKILHEGSWPHLGFYAADSKSYREVLKGRQEGVIYRPLTSYGRRVFRLCLGALLVGATLAEESRLHELFVHNQERLESICKQLTQEHVEAQEKLRQVAQDIQDLHDHWLESEQLTELKTVIGTGKQLVAVYLDTKPQLPSEIMSSLEGMLQQDEDATESDQLKGFVELVNSFDTWKGRRVPPSSADQVDPTSVIRLYLGYATKPGFLLRSRGYNL